MSGLELLAVVACVAAVCSAYHDGAELVHQIKAKRKARRALHQEVSSQNFSTSELEKSLTRGEEVVRSQYDRDFRRFGASFEFGDRKCYSTPSNQSVWTHIIPEIARDALKDVTIDLQRQVISNLKIQWQQDTLVDFDALQDASDSTQDRAILVLMHLQQRIITAGSIENLIPPPLFASQFPVNNRNPTHLTQRIAAPPSPPPSEVSSGTFPAPFDYAPSTFLTPSSAATEAQTEKKSSRYPRFWRSKGAKRSSDGSIESRFKMPPSQSDEHKHCYDIGASQETVIRHHPAMEIFDTRHPSISTTSSGAFEPETPDFNPWVVQGSPALSRNSPGSSFSSGSRHRVPTSTLEAFAPPMSNLSVIPKDILSINVSMNPKDLLPSEANKFAGFCKGAWRLQIGDKKKAMGERERLIGMYTTNKYWQCSRCNFEGRMVIRDKKTKGYDNRITATEGIQLRWEFLFKSHVEFRDINSDPLSASFGCMFCCAEGRGTPTFGGIQSLMGHLQEHRDRLPSGEVLYRMNCLVGRRAEPTEDFDINLEGRILEEI